MEKHDPAKSGVAADSPNGWCIGGFTITCVYVAAFCVSTDERRRICSIALVPDLQFAEWFGSDFARFGFLDRLPILFAAGCILAVAFLFGRLLLDALCVDRWLNRLERFVLATGLGLHALSLLTLAMGLANQLGSRWWCYVTAVSVLGLAVWRWRAWRAVVETKPVARDLLQVTVFWFAIPFAATILLGAMLPPWHFDVREYHLQIPKEWFQQGSIGFVPHNVYGNMPLGAENHAVLGMLLTWGPQRWWVGALIGKLVIAAFAPLTALALYASGRRFLDARAGALSALLFISTPWVTFVSASGLIDCVTGYYFLCAIHATLLWIKMRKDGDDFGRRWGLVIVAGLLVGGAISCKYTAILFLATPLFIAFALLPRSRFDWKPATAFALATLLGCGLWLGKNQVLAGNPVYPLLYEVFDGKTRTLEKHEQWSRAHRTPRDGAGRRFSVQQFTHSAWQLSWGSRALSPLLVPLALWGVCARRKDKHVWALLAFVAFMVTVWWLFTHRLDRFLLPALPLVALIAGAGITRPQGKTWQHVIIGLLIVPSLFNVLFTTSRFVGDNRFFVSLEDLHIDIPREQDFDYSHTHRAHRMLNRTVEEGYKVLAVGEAQVFDFEMPVIYNTCFDDCQFERLMRDKTRAERYAGLRDNRISHVFVFWRELDRYRSPGNYGYSDYVTRDLVRRVLVEQQQLLRPVSADLRPESSEIFEVVGWRDWQ